jgi:hypothetical protein
MLIIAAIFPVEIEIAFKMTLIIDMTTLVSITKAGCIWSQIIEFLGRG